MKHAACGLRFYLEIPLGNVQGIDSIIGHDEAVCASVARFLGWEDNGKDEGGRGKLRYELAGGKGGNRGLRGRGKRKRVHFSADGVREEQ